MRCWKFFLTWILLAKKSIKIISPTLNWFIIINTHCHLLPKSEVTWFPALRPTTPNMDTSAGSPTSTPPTTPGSSPLYLKTVLYQWELKVGATQLYPDNSATKKWWTFHFLSFSTGKPVLPDPKVLAERFFKRKKFKPDPQGTNLMFAFMAQHFTHQFFKTNHDTKGGFTKALGHGVSYTYKCTYDSWILWL